MTKLYSQYLKNESGQMAIMFALGSAVLLTLVGSAVSMADLVNKKSELQSHADILSLATAKLLVHDKNGESRANAYLETYSSTELEDRESCEISTSFDPMSSTATCRGTADGFLTLFLGEDILNYSVISTSVLGLPKANEISFVFDISQSMHGQEIADLRNGLRTLIDSNAFDNPQSRVSLIPFAATVRLDQSFQNKIDASSGYLPTDGEYNGCFELEATDINVDFNARNDFTLQPTYNENGKKRFCQSEDMTALFHYRPDHFDIRDLIKNIDTTWGTGSSSALMWGYRSLVPDMAGVLSTAQDYPLSSSESSKHLIFMSDGKPSAGKNVVTPHDPKKRFDDYCAQIPFNQQNIHVHMINYNGNLGSVGVQRMKNCVKGDGKYYEVDVGDLPEVIKQITGQTEELRITR